MNDPHLDTAEAARRAGVSGDTIRRWARQGYLHPIRVGPGRRYRINAEELSAVIDGSATSTAEASAQPSGDLAETGEAVP